MKRLLLFSSFLAVAASACGGTSRPASSPAAGASTQTVFDAVSPSVVAILNDDRAIREEEANLALKEAGVNRTRRRRSSTSRSARSQCRTERASRSTAASSSPPRTSSSRPR